MPVGGGGEGGRWLCYVGPLSRGLLAVSGVFLGSSKVVGPTFTQCLGSFPSTEGVGPFQAVSEVFTLSSHLSHTQHHTYSFCNPS